MHPTPQYMKARQRDQARLLELRARTEAITGYPGGSNIPMPVLREMHKTLQAQWILSNLTWAQQVEYGLYNSYRRVYLN